MIGIGVDLCEVDRMRAALERTPTLRARVFTDDEQAYCDRRKDPTERYAARFAAKEAVMKAMGVGVGACKWREIEVAKARSRRAVGPPPRRRAAPGRRASASSGWRLTLTHTHRIAEAIAVAL